MEIRTMTLIKSTKGLIAMAGLIGGLALTSAPAFARRDYPPPPPAATYQLVPTSQTAQLLSCNHMMQDHGVSSVPPATSMRNNGLNHLHELNAPQH
jgi:hypothetical protein